MVIKIEPQRLEEKIYKPTRGEMVVSKKISFDAAHFLPNYEGRCRNMHGHTWVVELGVKGKVKEDGMVIDFILLKEFLEGWVREVFDHKLVNEVIKNPTAENIALYISKIWVKWVEAKRLQDVSLAFIKVWETEDSMVMVEGGIY